MSLPRITVEATKTRLGAPRYIVTIHEGPGHHGEAETVPKALAYAAYAWAYWLAREGGE